MTRFAKFSAWLQGAAVSLGGVGVFAIAFFDSSVLSFPFFDDLLVMHLSMRAPARMPYYALMAVVGSLAGCFWLYYLAKKGGEVMYRRRTGQRAERVRAWVQRNGFLSVVIPSILPPPMPFKVFVLAAGVFEVPMRTFALALVVGRGLRFFGEGFLAIRYGEAATRYLVENKLEFTAILVVTIVLSYLAVRWLFRDSQSPR